MTLQNRTKKPTYLNVVSATLRANRKKLNTDPSAKIDKPITARSSRSGSPQYAHQVDILDATGKAVASLVYRPDRPLGCGAVVYVVCSEGVRIKSTPPPPPKQRKVSCRLKPRG